MFEFSNILLDFKLVNLLAAIAKITGRSKTENNILGLLF